MAKSAASTVRATYTPKETFWRDYQGVPERFTHNVTFIEEGHELLTMWPEMFEPVKARYRADVEAATAAPGERR